MRPTWFRRPDTLILLILLSLISAATLSGCAETTFKVVDSDVKQNLDPKAKTVDTDRNGIRYYAPATYVLVKPDYTKGKAEVVVFNAPDTTITYAADSTSWLSTHKTELSFENGMLTKVLSKPDTTKIAVDTVGALSAIASKGLEAAAAAAKAASLGPRSLTDDPAIFLYRMETNGSLKAVDLMWTK
jgi:hypothetical protein